MRIAWFTTCVSVLAASAAVASPISQKYAALGGQAGLLGPSTGGETAVAGGQMQTFKNGNIYYSDSAHGAFEVHGLILQKYATLGGPSGELGFPVTDEMNMYDNWGRVSKFQKGQLVYRPTPGDVHEVKIADLQVDLPTPEGESWSVAQTYNGVSHTGPFVYCYDFYSADGNTKGKPALASADATIVGFEDDHDSGDGLEANYVGQALGQGRYSSTLHIQKGSYWAHAPKNMLWLGWPGYKVKSGAVVANIGDTGTTVGNYHLHYCVTTSPDRKIYAPFESVPVSFRNFEISKDNVHWATVGVGVPAAGDYVRRKKNTAGGPPTVNAQIVTETVNFGSVKGEVLFPPGFKAASGDRVNITAETAWGEPVGSVSIAIITAWNDQGPVKFSFGKVVDFNNLKIIASVDGPITPSNYWLNGTSGTFNVAPNATSTVNVTLKPIKMPQ